MTVHLREGEACTRVVLGVVEQPSVTVLLGKSFIDRSLKSIFQGERKVVSYNSSEVPILMVWDCEIKNGKSQTEEDSSLNLQTVSEASDVYIRVARGICLRSHCEIPVLVSPKAAGLVEIHPHGTVSKRHVCMDASGVIGKYPEGPFLSIWQASPIRTLGYTNTKRLLSP